MNETSEWARVRKGNPCPICSKPDWCTYTEEVVLCMRVPNDHPIQLVTGDVGYLHRRTGSPIEFIRRPAPPKRMSLDEVRSLNESFLRDPRRRAFLKHVAGKLGVTRQSLKRIGVGVGEDGHGMFSSWPCRESEGQVVGIVRRYLNGRKLTMKGTSSSGVFFGKRWWECPGPVLIVEGGADVAACLDNNACVIGRPSCAQGSEVIYSALLRRAKDREVWVVAERDRKEGRCPVECYGCMNCWPGLAGASHVALQLTQRTGKLCKVVFPRWGKDVREMHLLGRWEFK